MEEVADDDEAVEEEMSEPLVFPLSNSDRSLTSSQNLLSRSEKNRNGCFLPGERINTRHKSLMKREWTEGKLKTFGVRLHNTISFLGWRWRTSLAANTWYDWLKG